MFSSMNPLREDASSIINPRGNSILFRKECINQQNGKIKYLKQQLIRKVYIQHSKNIQELKHWINSYILRQQLTKKLQSLKI